MNRRNLFAWLAGAPFGVAAALKWRPETFTERVERTRRKYREGFRLQGAETVTTSLDPLPLSGYRVTHTYPGGVNVRGGGVQWIECRMASGYEARVGDLVAFNDRGEVEPA